MSERERTPDADAGTPDPETDARLATLLRDEADLASDGIHPPPLEDLQRRARRRNRRPWVVAGGLAAAAAVAALVWVNLPGQEGAVGPAAPDGPAATDEPTTPDGPVVEAPIASTFPVPTYAWEGGGDGALVAGSLAFTDAGCPLLVFGESATPLILPNATGVTYDNGVRGVVDDQGRVYATEGQTMEYGGGWQEPMTGEFAEAWDSVCGDTPARDLVYVNDVAAHEALTEAPEPPPDDLPTAPTSREEAGWFDVPTFEFDVDGPREEALIEGVVQFTDEGCPFVEADGTRTGLVFPNAEGFQAPGTDEPRMIYAYFEGGSSGVMAVEGESISWGGGGGAADDERWTSVCSTPVDSIFIVQDSPFD